MQANKSKNLQCACMHMHHVAVTGASIYLQGIWFSLINVMDTRKWQLSMHLSPSSQHIGAQVGE